MASGQAGYHPVLLTRLLLYGYCVGVASSRAIGEALWRHDVARDTADFTAQYNLGAILQLGGQTSEALPHYQATAALRPTDAIANNALGCVLLALGTNPTGHRPAASRHPVASRLFRRLLLWALHWPRSANLLPRKRIGNAP
jgi:hypothetical protein